MEQTQSTQNLICCKCKKIATSKQEAENELSYAENYSVEFQRKEPQEKVICEECKLDHLTEQNIQHLNQKQIETVIKINEQGEKVWNQKSNRI